MIGLGERAKILFDGNDVVVPDGVAYTDLIFLADSQSHGGLTIPSYERGVARLLRYDRHP